MKTQVVTRLAFITAGLLWTSFAEAQWGTIKGQILVDGELPKRRDLVANVGGIGNVPDETVVVDAKTKGLANLVILPVNTPTTIHPDLLKSKVTHVVFDQQRYRFVPHVLLVRTDQQVQVVSGDPVVHNVHTLPVRNPNENFNVQPNDRKGVTVNVKKAERLPTAVVSDVYPWMRSWWMVVDNPYAAVTNDKGEFEIANLPVGDHVFLIWHEKAGYVDKALQIKVKDGENVLPALDYPATLFQ
jgi:hypothetical protein